MGTGAAARCAACLILRPSLATRHRWVGACCAHSPLARLRVGRRPDACRARQYRYCNSKFYDTLRSWHGLRDVSETTRKDWRVSAADNLGMKGGEGAYGHDQSNNDADGWKRSSTIWVDSTFRGGLRDYVGHDVSLDEEGHPRAHSKDGKFAAGTNLGNIYRSTKQANVLSTARADECFLGSLRSAPIKSAADYQRQRRRNLGLPAQEKGASPKSGSRPSSARSATPTR